MRPSLPRPLAFVLSSAAVLLLLLLLLWGMALRENSSRRLSLEFSAYRVSTRLVEEYLQDPASLKVTAEVAALGIYGPSGEALLRVGEAPEDLEVPRQPTLSFDHLERSRAVVLTRPFGLNWGLDHGDMPMMRRMGRGQGSATGPGLGYGTGRAIPAAPGSPPQPPGGGPGLSGRILWLEYSDSGVNEANVLTLVAATAITLGLLALYALLLRLSRRNRELREREAANRELVQLGEAARTLVHEIKNPLAVIRIQAATIRRSAPGAANLAEKADIIDEEVARLGALSDRIRDYLKGGAGEASPLELGAFLGDFAARYEGGPEGKGVILAPPPPEAWVLVDPAKLAGALDNLVVNALEASPMGSPVDLLLSARGRTWEIAVGDRGPGVAEADLPRLFEPFFTTKEKGSGIGLALARRVAEASGGSLAYKARSGGGALFVLSLPKASPGPARES